MSYQRERVLSIAGRIENELTRYDELDDFSAWLLREYIPKLHSGDLPSRGIYDRARAAWIAHGPEADAPKRLLELVLELDRALYFAFDVLRYGTFESEHASGAKGFSTRLGRPFAQKFTKSSTRFVAFQIEISHPYTRANKIAIPFRWVLRKENGDYVHEESEVLTFQDNWQTSWIAQTWGSTKAGTWEVGTYDALAYCEDRPWLSTRFDII